MRKGEAGRVCRQKTHIIGTPMKGGEKEEAGSEGQNLSLEVRLVLMSCFIPFVIQGV